MLKRTSMRVTGGSGGTNGKLYTMRATRQRGNPVAKEGLGVLEAKVHSELSATSHGRASDRAPEKAALLSH